MFINFEKKRALYNYSLCVFSEISLFWELGNLLYYYIYLQEYQKLTRLEGCNPDTWCNLACCLFMLGMYSNADSASSRGELVPCSLNHSTHAVSVLVLPPQDPRDDCKTDYSSTSLTRQDIVCCYNY